MKAKKIVFVLLSCLFALSLAAFVACEETGSEDVPATDIKLNKSTLTLEVGDEETLTATLTPADSTAAVTWSSSAEAFATVSGGTVTAIAEGTAVITAAAGDVSATCTVTVVKNGEVPSDVPVESVTISGDANVVVGGTLQLSAAVAPDNATDKTVEWSSSDAQIASVDQTGKVTGVSVGEATITAEAGGKSDTHKVTVTEEPVVTYTVSGLAGNGYTVKVDGLTASEGSVRVEEGATITFSLELDDMAYESAPVVKIGGEELSAEAGKYSYTVNADTAIEVTGVVVYEKIEDSPLSFAAGSTTTDDLASPMSSASNVYTIALTDIDGPFKSTKLAPYTSVLFYARAVNGADTNYWIALNDSLGKFNAKDTQLYGNGDPQAPGKPDSVWHKFELRREEGSDGTYYQLYVDGVKHEKLDAETPVVARAFTRLSDIYPHFNQDGVYHFSELFAVPDPDYVEVPVVYESVADHPFAAVDMETELSENFPEDDDIAYAYSFTGKWTANGDPLLDLPLAPYLSVKFYINPVGATCWVVTKSAEDHSDIYANIRPSSGWHQFLIEREGDGWSLLIDGEVQEFTFRKNLNEIAFQLNADEYYVSEVVAAANPDYVAPAYTAYSDKITEFEGTEDTAVLPDFTGAAKSWKISPAAWAQKNFIALPLAQFEEAVFFVKGTSAQGKYISISDAAGSLASINDDDWHEIRLSNYGGYMVVLVDGLRKATVADLSQLKMSLNEGADYYVSQLFVLENEAYDPAELTVQSGTGYTVNVNIFPLTEGKADIDKGSEVSFTVTLGEDYSDSTFTVKVNGTAVAAENGVYTFVMEGDATITVEGVVLNQYTVTFPEEDDFTLTVDGQETGTFDITCGEEVSFTITPEGENVGKQITVKANGEPLTVGDNGKYSFIVETDTDITIEFGEVVDLWPTVFENPVPSLNPTQTIQSGLPKDTHIINVITGAWAQNGRALPDLDLSSYEELKFSFKAVDGKYFEILDENGTAVKFQRDGRDWTFAFNDAEWHTVRIVKEGDVWRVYYGEYTTSYTITNLSQLHVQLGDNGVFHLTDVVGVELPVQAA